MIYSPMQPKIARFTERFFYFFTTAFFGFFDSFLCELFPFAIYFFDYVYTSSIPKLFSLSNCFTQCRQVHFAVLGTYIQI